MSGRPDDPTRRDVLKLAAGAAAAVPLAPAAGWLPGVEQATAVPAPRFFTREQFALVDVLTEIIIPADEHSGGARAAQVAAEIDRRLSEAFEPELKQLWLDGVTLVDTRAKSQHGRPFLQLSPQEQEGIVAAMAEAADAPRNDAGRFFVELKRRTVDAYYTSKVGIHDDLEYKGNTVQAEYSGIDVSSGN